MRFSLAPPLISAVLAGCTPGSVNLSGDNQQSESRRGAAAPAVAIAATGPGNCTASWNGTPASPDQIAERSVALLQQVVDAAGGPQNVTENMLPVADVEAPADLSFACADTILFALQRSGMSGARLRPARDQASVLADFPVDMNAPPPPIPMVIGLGAGGRMTWNDVPIDAAALDRHLGAHGSTAPSEPGAQPPPGGMELRVTREAIFGQLYQLLRTMQRYQLRPVLYLPSAEAAPPGTTAPPPPPGDPLANRR